jgi:hypothetical protein
MNKPEHILRQEGAVKRPRDCTCDDGYWMRNLIDPECHYHGVYGEELRELITKLCDAFERYKLLWDGDKELLQQGREAASGR